jgi:S-formylglutathione hydrolase FrmB
MEKNIVIKNEKIASESLRGNALEDPAEREVIFIDCNATDSSPVLIGLAGFFGSARNFLNRSYSNQDFLSTLENILGRNPDLSFSVVLPDTMTLLGGNQYLNSPAVGNYEDSIAKEIVDLIRSRYGKRKIGLFGKSSGGFGSYTLTARNPSIFSGFIDVSGDSAFEYCYMRDFPAAIEIVSKSGIAAFLKDFRSRPTHSHKEMDAINIIAMSAFYSPGHGYEMGIELPFETETGILRGDVWKKWKKMDPVENVTEFASGLTGKTILLQAGLKDEFAINIGIRALSRRMDKLGIKNRLMEYDEGHFSIEYLYEDSIPLLVRGLSEQ